MNGEINTARIRTRLNNKEDITIIIEWDAVEEGELVNKGYNQFVAGAAIQFLFDYYDSKGIYVETETDSKRSDH